MMKVPIPSVPSGQTIGPRIVRCLMNTDPDVLAPDNVLPQLKLASVSHLNFQIFWGGAPSLDIYQQWWKSVLKPKLMTAMLAGFRVIGMADETFRTPDETNQTHINPVKMDCIKFTAHELSMTGIVDSVEVVDEAHNPSEYAPVQPFVDAWRAAGGPPIAWPNIAPEAWETDGLSDYTSRYWPAWSGGDFPFSRQATLIQTYCINRLRKDRQWYGFANCCGPIVIDGYQLNSGFENLDPVGQVWLALAYGASGIKMYGYDWKPWRDARVDPPLHTQVQIGADPEDASRWNGVNQAFTSIVKYQDILTRKPFTPVVSGNWVYGRRGEAPYSTVWGVNTQTGMVKWWDLLQLLNQGGSP